jgi:hypothetical protein
MARILGTGNDEVYIWWLLQIRFNENTRNMVDPYIMMYDKDEGT